MLAAFTNRPTAERVGLVALAGLLVAWVIAAFVDDAVFFQPVLFGFGTGSIIAALALGLVVAYRASGVINFGHGAIATYVTYVYVSLTDTGDYPIPPLPNPVAPIEGIFDIEIFDFPTLIGLGGAMGKAPAMLIALATAAVLGLLAHFAVFRPLRYAPVLAKVVASVGIMLFLQAAVVLRFDQQLIHSPR